MAAHRLNREAGTAWSNAVAVCNSLFATASRTFKPKLHDHFECTLRTFFRCASPWTFFGRDNYIGFPHLGVQQDSMSDHRPS